VFDRSQLPRFSSPDDFRSTLSTYTGAGQLLEFIQSVFDPMSYAARLPINNEAPSLPVQMTYSTTFATDSNGRAAIAVAPHKTGIYDAPTFSGSTVTSWGSPTSFDHAPADSIKARPVSMGIRYRWTGDDTTKGFVTVYKGPGNTSSKWPTAYSDAFNSDIKKRWNCRENWGFTAGLFGAEADVYHDVGSSFEDVMETFIVFIEGAPASTTIGVLDVSFNIEVQTDFGTKGYGGNNYIPGFVQDTDVSNEWYQSFMDLTQTFSGAASTIMHGAALAKATMLALEAWQYNDPRRLVDVARIARGWSADASF
jgi:hypothetical protein